MDHPLLASIEITRPHNMLITALAVVAGYVIAGGSNASEVWPTALFTAAVTGAGNVVNDIYDVHVDQVNKPRRPLPSGRLTRRAAAVMYLAGTTMVTAGAFAFLPSQVTALVLSWQLALFVYARWAKRILIAGNLLIASVTSSVFVAGALLTGNVSAAAVPVAFAAVFVMGRELVKGAEDVEGDRNSGVLTVAAVLGEDRAGRAAAALLLLLAAAIPAPALAGYFGTVYLWVMELTVVPGLLVATLLVVKHPGKPVYSLVSWLLKVEMVFGIVAMGADKL